MRLFVAVNLGATERKRIHRGLEPLRESGYPVRWLDAGTYHLTLKFMGSVDPRRLNDLASVLDRVAAGNRPFKLSIGGVGAFPTIRRPKVMWVGVDPSPALRCLKQDLEWGMAECGQERETRAFHPHLTVGRAGDKDGAGAFRGLDEMASAVDITASVHVKTVELMRSHLSKSGARYEVLHSSALGGAGKRG